MVWTGTDTCDVQFAQHDDGKCLSFVFRVNSNGFDTPDSGNRRCLENVPLALGWGGSFQVLIRLAKSLDRLM